jgi:hypothetical protein
VSETICRRKERRVRRFFSRGMRGGECEEAEDGERVRKGDRVRFVGAVDADSAERWGDVAGEAEGEESEEERGGSSSPLAVPAAVRAAEDA